MFVVLVETVHRLNLHGNGYIRCKVIIILVRLNILYNYYESLWRQSFFFNITLKKHALKDFKSQGVKTVVTLRPDPDNAGSNGYTKQNLLHGIWISVGYEYLTENKNNTCKLIALIIDLIVTS